MATIFDRTPMQEIWRRDYERGFKEMIDLRHGDCYELIKDIPDKSIDLIYVDIPYLYKHTAIAKETSSDLFKRASRKMNKDLKEIINGIDYKILDDFVRISKHIYIYIWCSKEQILDLAKYFIGKMNCNFDFLVWCKTNPTPTAYNSYLPDLEYCLLFKEKGAPRFNEGYDLKSKWYVSKLNTSDKDNFNHPTIKPLDLVKRHILHSTQPGDTVLDCFMGSGTTGVACKETGRNFIGMEIDDEYFKIAQDRLNGITASGQTSIFTDFEQLENEIK